MAAVMAKAIVRLRTRPLPDLQYWRSQNCIDRQRTPAPVPAPSGCRCADGRSDRDLPPDSVVEIGRQVAI